LGIPADARSGAYPGGRLIPNLDSGRVVRDSSARAFSGTGDPAARAGAGSAQIAVSYQPVYHQVNLSSQKVDDFSSYQVP